MEENSKKTRVREMFDSIAPRYDLLNHLLSFGVDRLWRRRMVGVVAAGTPAAILDVAAGTGDVAVALARRLPAARITGCFAPAAGSVSSNFRRPADVVSARCTGSISTVSCRWWGA